MQQHGFIHDMLDVKVLILFVASKALYPLSLQKIYELCFQDDCLSYFDVSVAVPQMVESGHLEKTGEDEYVITDKGREQEEVTSDADCVSGDAAGAGRGGSGSTARSSAEHGTHGGDPTRGRRFFRGAWAGRREEQSDDIGTHGPDADARPRTGPCVQPEGGENFSVGDDRAFGGSGGEKQ